MTRASGPLLSIDVIVAKLEAWVATPREALLGEGQELASQTPAQQIWTGGLLVGGGQK